MSLSNKSVDPFSFTWRYLASLIFGIDLCNRGSAGLVSSLHSFYRPELRSRDSEENVVAGELLFHDGPVSGQRESIRKTPRIGVFILQRVVVRFMFFSSFTCRIMGRIWDTAGDNRYGFFTACALQRFFD
jgi:hypothetical protein